jgi:uncharacterized protein
MIAGPLGEAGESGVAEHGSAGMPIAMEPRTERAIVRSATGITAFVGRALKGPLDRPVRIAGLVDFQRIFGGLWQPSTLSYAIEQYFESGGQQALVVRVANGARPPTLSLPAGASELRLVALNPGSREYLRASVDYDGIADHDTDRFNLIVQRLRIPASEQIEDQEIFRAVSVERIRDLALESRLIRIEAPLPPARPDRTSKGADRAVHYVSSRSDGDDGAPLSDYDVIGSATDRKGLLALGAEEPFDLLCIPPLSREQDAGLTTLLVAARLCRERHAMLIVDPPAEWGSAESALSAMRSWPFRSENAAMFFPRIVTLDRLRNRPETFGSAAAAAGMLARADRALPVWAPAEAEEPILRAGMKLAVAVTQAQRAKLAHSGINTLQTARSTHRERICACTLASSGASDWKHLAERRLALFILASIERGVGWLASAPSNPQTWARAEAEVAQFLDELHLEGAFAGGRPEDSYFVICDERVNRAETVAEGKNQLLFGIATGRPGAFHAWMVTCQAGASRVRAVAVNRLAATPGAAGVDWET